MPFRRCIRYLPTSKNTLLFCCWKRHHVIFLLVQHISLMVVQFVTGGPFFFSFFSLSSLENYSLALLVVGISIVVLILFLIFCLGFFLLKFYLFSILSFNPNLLNIIFSNLILILWISTFFFVLALM
jgi:hypothetical protein